MAKAPAKKPSAAKKDPVKKPAAAKVVAKKPTAKKAAPAKKIVAKKPAAKTRSISAEERYKMIEVAAYYIAERNHFKGNSTDFWIAAEAEISAKLANKKGATLIKMRLN